MPIDRDRKYTLTHSPAGVGFQLEGIMPTMAYLTWEQAEMLRADLDAACEAHEKELAERLPAE